MLGFLSLRGRFLITPIIGIILTLILYFSSNSVIRSHSELFQHLSKSNLPQVSEITQISVLLSNNHGKLSALLLSAQNDPNEEKVYLNGRKILNELHALEDRLNFSLASSNNIVINQIDIFKEISNQFENYRSASISAIELSTVNTKLAHKELMNSDNVLHHLNEVFLILSEYYVKNLTLGAELVEDSLYDDNTITILAVILLILMFFSAFYFSKRMSSDLDSINQALIALSEGGKNIQLPKQTDKYLQQLTSAVHKFQQTLHINQEQQVEINNTTEDLNRSNERYLAIFNNALDGILMMDVSGKQLLDANNIAGQMLGYQKEEFLQLGIKDIHPQKDLPQIMVQFEKQQRGEVMTAIDIPILRKDGSIFFADISSAPFHLGNHTYSAVVLRDITERKIAQDKLRQAHGELEARVEERTKELVSEVAERKIAEQNIKRFKATLDETLDCVFMFRADTLKLFYVNQGAIRQVGYEFDELINMTPFDIKPLFDEKEFRNLIIPLVSAEQQIITFETIHRHKDGHEIPVEIFLQYIQLPHEEPHFIAIVRDITERKHIEQVLLAANEKLEERVQARTAEYLHAKEEAEQANQAKSEFLSSMSHELRTPLNAILGFSQLMSLEVEDERLKENINEIYNAGQHLLTLINEILDLSKIESGNFEVSLENIELSTLLNECLVLINPLATKRDIRIIDHITHVKQHCIVADHKGFKQIMINLLSNAIKYNKQGGSVTINSTTISSGRLRIGISDTGLGLNTTQQEKLFKPFERIGAETTDIEGTGIGLIISKKLIEIMGGAIGVDSEPGCGSTFWVEINLAQSNGQLTLPDKQFKKDVKITDFKNASPKRILYIEDNPSNLKLLTDVIDKQTPYKLISAPNASLGLSLAVSQHPDLILMDIKLPGIDGYEALRSIRNNKDIQDTPVIAISANAMKYDITKGKAAGFEDYVTKPYRITELLHVVNKTLQDSE